MTGQLWAVRAGEQARYVSEFESGGYVAGGFRELATDDLVAAGSDVLKAQPTNNAAWTLSFEEGKMSPGTIVGAIRRWLTCTPSPGVAVGG